MKMMRFTQLTRDIVMIKPKIIRGRILFPIVARTGENGNSSFESKRIFHSICAFTQKTQDEIENDRLRKMDEEIGGFSYDYLLKISEDAKELCEESMYLASQNKYKECVQKATRALDALGVIDLNLEKTETSDLEREHLTNMISIIRSKAYTYRAISNLNLNVDKNLIHSDLQNAIACDELNPKATLTYGTLLLSEGKPELAIQYLNYAVFADPNSSEPYLKRAQALDLLGDNILREDLKSILIDTSTAITNGASQNPLPYFLRAKAILENESGKFEKFEGRMWTLDQAIADFSMSIQLEGDIISCLFKRATCYGLKHEYENALRDLYEIRAFLRALIPKKQYKSLGYAATLKEAIKVFKRKAKEQAATPSAQSQV